jgi:hypothetical protein
MPAQILHRGASVNCSHFPGEATPNTTFARVKVAGQEVVTLKNQYTIEGCPLNSPCLTGQWTSGAIKVKAGGEPVAIFSGGSTCAPTGNPMKPVRAQTRVRAT